MKRLYFVANQTFVSTVIKHANNHLEERRSFFSFSFSFLSGISYYTEKFKIGSAESMKLMERFYKLNHLLFRNEVARELWISVFVFLPRWSGYSPGSG